jgi:acetylornithine deacetylase/succinyl-diaminopimelate desuccinylase-like protein
MIAYNPCTACTAGRLVSTRIARVQAERNLRTAAQARTLAAQPASGLAGKDAMGVAQGGGKRQGDRFLKFSLCLALLAAGSVSVVAQAASAAHAPAYAAQDWQRFRALYRELVEIDTTRSAGDCTRAAEAMRAHLLAAGYSAEQARIYAPADRPRDGALIARLPGRDATLAPILLLAHIDVVEASAADWGRDPFTLVEADGWFSARGASDDKAMAAVFTDSMIRYREQGYRPKRGLTLALTCGEETPDIFNSVEWLLREHPDTLRAAFALNEGASGELDAQGRPITLQIQAGEKTYQDFALEATDSGGHSSRPTLDSPITRMSNALAKLGAYRFPVQLNPVTSAYFEQQIALAPQGAAEFRQLLEGRDVEAAADRLWRDNPGWNSMLRTTCVATMVDAGHAPNALPQRATANVNCRILPGVPVEDIRRQLETVIGDGKVSVRAVGARAVIAPVPPMPPAILDPVRRLAAQLWPGAVLVPTLATGATDGRFLNAAGIPTYGLSGIFHDAEGPRAHGIHERIRVKSLYDSRRFLHEIVQVYADAE